METGTRLDVASSINFNLNHIKRSLDSDARQIETLIEAISNWAADKPDEEYKGQVGARVLELMTSLTNNSGWVSYMAAAIREAK